MQFPILFPYFKGFDKFGISYQLIMSSIEIHTNDLQ